MAYSDLSRMGLSGRPRAMQPGSVRSQDFAQYVPYHLTKSSERLGWNGFRVEIVRGHEASEIALPPLDHHLLNLIVSVPTLHAHRWDGLVREETGQEGAASIVPAGRESYWRWRYLEAGTPCDFHLHLDPGFVRRVAVKNLDDLPPAVEFRGDLCFYNSHLRTLCGSLMAEVEHQGMHGALYAESLATAIVTVLLKVQEPWRISAAPSSSPASKTSLRLVCDHIEANLAGDLHLESLGQLIGLGPDRFGEVFRSTLGVSPYRYVLQRRMDRARVLLHSTSLTITEIAVNLGFADHAHFTSTFRRLTEITPSRFRRESLR